MSNNDVERPGGDDTNLRMHSPSPYDALLHAPETHVGAPHDLQQQVLAQRLDQLRGVLEHQNELAQHYANGNGNQNDAREYERFAHDQRRQLEWQQQRERALIDNQAERTRELEQRQALQLDARLKAEEQARKEGNHDFLSGWRERMDERHREETVMLRQQFTVESDRLRNERDDLMRQMQHDRDTFRDAIRSSPGPSERQAAVRDIFRRQDEDQQRRLADELHKHTQDSAEQTRSAMATAAHNALTRGFSETPEIRQLWERATRAVSPTAESAFANARRNFWRLVNGSDSAEGRVVRQMLEEAGYSLRGGQRAPMLNTAGDWDNHAGREAADRRLSIDHAAPQANNPASILDASNLRFMSQRDNSFRGHRFTSDDKPHVK